MTPLNRRAALAAGLMAGASLLGARMIPTRRLADLRPFDLAATVPARFGDWAIDPHAVGGVVDPQAQALVDKLYTQTLSRTFVNAQGQRVMLSLAYGADQSDNSVQLHYPEVCYPAQGFRVMGSSLGEVTTVGGRIRVRRLSTAQAGQRFEPLSYWTIVGDRQSLGAWDRKRAEIEHGLRGEIIDGLLIRVSTISRDTEAAYALQDRFIADLVGAIAPEQRWRVAGRPQ